MRTVSRFVLTTILTLILFSASSQQEKWPSTFLWRISGNGLQKDSWLLGTIHLQDKRLFNFGDSLYAALEKAEGYALEVNLQEYIDSIINRAFLSAFADEEETEVKVAPAPPTSPPPGVTMEKSDMPPEIEKLDKKTKKQRMLIRRQELFNILKYGEMPTIMDAYLYGIARRKGKWLGAVEDVSDQLGLLDEMGGDAQDDKWITEKGREEFTLEKMIQTYLAYDLQTIENRYMKEVDGKWVDKVLIERNHKMAASMKRLSADRSMFFAVGVAHLPGEEGVINLLRKMGYQVTPVFSKNKIHAEKYNENLAQIPWITMVEAEDSTYSVELPGIPTEFKPMGNAVNMKLLLDISTMTFYLAGHTIGYSENSNLNLVLDEMARSMGVSSRNYSKKPLELNGIKGVEGDLRAKDVYFRVQLFVKDKLLYMLFVGAEKRNNVLSSDANRFFKSFRVMKASKQAVAADWVEFTIPEKYFKVNLPGKPKMNAVIQKQASAGGWESKVYDYANREKGIYMLIQVRELQSGYHITGDSALFADFRNGLDEIDSFELDRTFSINGFPAHDLLAVGEKGKAFIRARHVIRAGRVYSLLAAGSFENRYDPMVKDFVESFELLPIPEPALSRQYDTDNGFYSQLSDPLKRETDEQGEVDLSDLNYVSFNKAESVSYMVNKEALSRWKWYENDSLFFAKKSSLYIPWSDSVIREQPVKNGSLPGREYLIQSDDNHSLKKVRLILNGDTLYALTAFIPATEINKPNHLAFFDEFRVVNEVKKQTVFTKRTDEIFKALNASDSATFFEVQGVFADIEFSKEDLPILHKLLTRIYRDDSTEYYTLQDRVMNKIENLHDPSTVDFIKKNYGKVKENKDKVRKGMLAVLAGIQTADSYELLKELLLKDPPGKSDGIYMGFRLRDSLLLARNLFPETLGLLENPHWVADWVSLTSSLLDSALLDRETVLAYQKAIFHYADTSLASLKKQFADNPDELDSYGYNELINLLRHFGDLASVERLQEFLNIGDSYIRYYAALALLKGGNKVGAGVLETIASGNEYRTQLYAELKKLGKEELFPARYKTQRYFGESELYSYASDEYSPKEMIFLGERKAEYKGNSQRFYLFKVVFEYGEGETEEYLGMAGPFSLDEKELDLENVRVMMNYEEEYDRRKIDEVFKKLVKELEEYDE